MRKRTESSLPNRRRRKAWRGWRRRSVERERSKGAREEERFLTMMNYKKRGKELEWREISLDDSKQLDGAHTTYRPENEYPWYHQGRGDDGGWTRVHSVVLKAFFWEDSLWKRLDEQQSIHTPHIWRAGKSRRYPDTTRTQRLSKGIAFCHCSNDWLFIYPRFLSFLYCSRFPANTIAFMVLLTVECAYTILRRCLHLQSRRIIPFASYYRTINANDLVHIYELTLRNLQF